ncbi:MULTISPECIES: hypothetical protein [Methylosinus]|nr:MULTISPECIES: hypothetical protein [Methylosinus]
MAEGRRIEARFDGGTSASNAGAPLLGKSTLKRLERSKEAQSPL